MILMDVGNTFTKWQALKSDGEVASGEFLTRDVHSKTLELLEHSLRDTSFCISWVGSADKKDALVKALQLRTRKVRFAESQFESHGLKNGYKAFQNLGVDRWLAMLGVWGKIRAAFCVVDAGTALTIDFVSDDGMHLGGYILPGLKTMISSLNISTALIDCDVITEGLETLAPGRTTTEAVQRGIVVALAGAIEYSVQRTVERLVVPDIGRFIGGGDAGLLAPLLSGDWQIEGSLVLSGLKIYAQSE